MAREKSKYSLEVGQRLLELGFPPDFAEAMEGYLDTDFLARQMVGYLREARPKRAEDVVDEFLAILERREHIVRKHANAYYERKHPVEDLFLRELHINWDEEFEDAYVKEIPSLRSVDRLEFHENITFFVGENGSGKSTLLEAIAVGLKLNPEGGTKNYTFATYNDTSDLAAHMRLVKGMNRPKWSYFLRAESFFNVASAGRDYKTRDDYHACSHGESFLNFIQSNDSVGIYLMDEPEAALSPQRQLTLLIKLVRMAREGSQFIIVTHSPILLGIPDAEIWSFDEGSIETISYEETDSFQIMKGFLTNRHRYLEELLREDDEEEED